MALALTPSKLSILKIFNRNRKKDAAEHPVPLPGPGSPKRYLRRYKFEHPWSAYRGRILFVLILAAAAGLGMLFHGWSWHGETIKGTDVATAVTALGALILGYQQWREARHENSMERYYERLDIANRRREGARISVHEMMKSSIPRLRHEDPARLMYVYVELDNLEYVACKYRLGYMRPDQACRGLRTFQRRCISPEFRRIALDRVVAGDYTRATVNIVTEVCATMEKRLLELDRKELMIVRPSSMTIFGL